MSSLFCNNNNISNYLKLLENNPYLNELKHKIYYNKRKNLKKIMSSELVEKINDDNIDSIFNTITSSSDIHFITKKIKEDFENGLEIEKIENFEKYIQSLILEINNFKATSLRISTMTVCCSLNTTVNQNELYSLIKINTVYNEDTIYDEPIVVGIKFKNNIIGYFKNKNNVTFFNSITLNMFINHRYVNLKLFDNGQIQMTGVNNEDVGKKCIQKTISLLNSNKSIITKDIVLCNYKIALINSDYDCGFCIQRDVLYDLVLNDMKLSVTYEPENYPGVKIQYFWNDTKTGICNCKVKCIGKGNNEMNCKKVTISVFQSGKIIITGAKSLDKLHDAYHFANSILYNNIFKIIKKYNIKLEIKPDIMIKKKKISNYLLRGKLLLI